MVRVFGNDLGTASYGAGLVAGDPDIGVRCLALSYIETSPVKTPGITANESDRLRRRAIYDKLLTAVRTTKPDEIVYEIYTVRDAAWIDGLLKSSREVLRAFEIGKGDPRGLFGRLADLGVALRDAQWREGLINALAGMSKASTLAGNTRGRGKATEVLAVQGIVEAIGFAESVSLCGHQPGVRQQRLLGQAKGSKDDIIAAVRAGLPGYEDCLAKRIKLTVDEIRNMPPTTAENHMADAVAHAWIRSVDLLRAKYGAAADNWPGMRGVRPLGAGAGVREVMPQEPMDDVLGF